MFSSDDLDAYLVATYDNPPPLPRKLIIIRDQSGTRRYGKVLVKGEWVDVDRLCKEHRAKNRPKRLGRPPKDDQEKRSYKERRAESIEKASLIYADFPNHFDDKTCIRKLFALGFHGAVIAEVVGFHPSFVCRVLKGQR